MSDQRTVLLFSYGTLQLDEVQLSSFGRLLEGQADAMVGYRQSQIEITDPEVIKTSGKRFHPIDEFDDPIGLLANQLGQRPVFVACAYFEQLGCAANTGERVLNLMREHQPKRAY